MIDVPEVELNAFFHQVNRGSFSSQSVDLGPAGNARFDMMAEGIFPDQPFVFIVVEILPKFILVIYVDFIKERVFFLKVI